MDRSRTSDDLAAPDEKDPPDSSTSAVGRRELFRLMGAAAIPLIAPGCMSEQDEDWRKISQLRAENLDLVQSIKVQKAFLSQTILNRREELSINQDLAQYLEVGDQCRVTRNGSDALALYTIGEVLSEKSSNRVRMSLAARRRLEIEEPFNGKLYAKVVAEGLTDEEAEAQDEFVEHLVDDGENTGLIALAPHGGHIEPWTDEQAEYMRSYMAQHGKEVSLWICKGFKKDGGAFDRWHITSTAVSANSFPGLGELSGRPVKFEHAVSFHGLSDEKLVVVGGGEDTGGETGGLKKAVRDAIAAVVEPAGIEVTISSPTGAHAGYSEQNVVNRLTQTGRNGIQISECLQYVREADGLWRSIVEAVADVYLGLL